MAGKTAILAIRIISDATKAAKGFQQTETAAEKMSRRLDGASLAAGGVLAALGGAGAKARAEASELQQAAGAVESVFDKQAGAVDRLAKKAAGNLGLARSEYSQMAAVFGAQLKNMGTSGKELVPTTDKLLRLGGDLAATFGGKTSDAVEALSSLLRGERDPIERYGVSIKQADINARLAAQGQGKLTGAAKRQAETEATLAILMEQTAAAQGQRAREAGSDAQAAEIAAAKTKNAWAAAGAAVLPISTAMANAIAKAADWTTRHSRVTVVLAATVGGLAAAVLAVNGALKVYKATQVAIRGATIAWNVAQKALNVSLFANPIGLIVLAVVALVAGFVLAYKKSDKFREIVNKAGDAGKDAIGWVVDKTQMLIDKVRAVIDWIKQIKWPSPPKWMSKLGNKLGLGDDEGKGGPGRPPHPATPEGRGGPGSATIYSRPRNAGGGDTYIIQGAIDPVATARQIRQIQRRDDLRFARA